MLVPNNDITFSFPIKERNSESGYYYFDTRHLDQDMNYRTKRIFILSVFLLCFQVVYTQNILGISSYSYNHQQEQCDTINVDSLFNNDFF